MNTATMPANVVETPTLGPETALRGVVGWHVFRAVQPVRLRPRPDAHVEISDESAATHTVKLPTGELVHVRVSTYAQGGPVQREPESIDWERVKQLAIEAGVTVGVALGAVMVVHVFASTFRHVGG